MLQLSCSARSNNRNINSLRNSPGKRYIVAILGAVCIHAGKQNFPGSQFSALLNPIYHIYSRRSASAVHEYLPLILPRLFGIHRQYHTLTSEDFCTLTNNIRIFNCGRIYRGLIRPGLQHFAHILRSSYTSTYSKGNKYLGGAVPSHLYYGVPLFIGSGDIQKNQFIAAFLIITAGQLYGITGISKSHEIGALNDTAPFYIKAGNYSLSIHTYHSSAPAATLIASDKSREPV